MGIQERAGCQVPPVADWAKGQYSGGPLRIVSGLAENTNSIICDGSGEPETANGCPVLHRMRGPSAARHSCATLNPDQSNARSRERAQRPRAFFLTLTYMEVGYSETGGFAERMDEKSAFRPWGRKWRCSSRARHGRYPSTWQRTCPVFRFADYRELVRLW